MCSICSSKTEKWNFVHVKCTRAVEIIIFSWSLKKQQFYHQHGIELIAIEFLSAKVTVNYGAEKTEQKTNFEKWNKIVLLCIHWSRVSESISPKGLNLPSIWYSSYHRCFFINTLLLQTCPVFAALYATTYTIILFRFLKIYLFLFRLLLCHNLELLLRSGVQL